MGSRENFFRSVDRQNNNNNKKVSGPAHLKIKNIDQINKVTYGSDNISLLRDSTLSNVLNFHFYLFYCNRKEKYHITRKINRKNKNIYA